MQDFCDWLAATSVSLAIQGANWVVPLTQTAHILLMAVVMGSVVLLDLRLLGVGDIDLTVDATIRRTMPAVWLALPGLLLTGGILIIAEPARELLNPAFLLKMGLLLGTCALMAWLQRAASGLGRGLRWSLGASNLILWTAIVVAGRWIAYAQPE